jgi:hypothetical protein
MTVAVTAILLDKQAKAQKELMEKKSESEELKERNVKVFEKKSDLFSNFIEKLWSVLETKNISLEELSELTKTVSKDIIPYAKPESSQEILTKLNKIADNANTDKQDIQRAQKLQLIQGSVFDIINILSKEMGLGGEISPAIRKELNALEEKIIPIITAQEYVKKINELVQKKIPDLNSVKYCIDVSSGERKVLFWEIDKGMYLRVGDQWGRGVSHISFWADFWESRQYQDYRYRVRGDEKDWMKAYKDIYWNFSNGYNFDFNDFRNGKPLPENTLETLADKIKEFFEAKHEEFDNKTISEIIEECNNK